MTNHRMNTESINYLSEISNKKSPLTNHKSQITIHNSLITNHKQKITNVVEKMTICWLLPYMRYDFSICSFFYVPDIGEWGEHILKCDRKIQFRIFDLFYHESILWMQHIINSRFILKSIFLHYNFKDDHKKITPRKQDHKWKASWKVIVVIQTLWSDRALFMWTWMRLYSRAVASCRMSPPFSFQEFSSLCPNFRVLTTIPGNIKGLKT